MHFQSRAFQIRLEVDEHACHSRIALFSLAQREHQGDESFKYSFFSEEISGRFRLPRGRKKNQQLLKIFSVASDVELGCP